MAGHYHVVIWAADGRSDAGYSGITCVEIIVANVGQALQRAKELVPNKPFYHINNIIEHHDHKKIKDA